MNTLKAEGSSTLSLPEGSYIYSISASTPGSFAAISSDDSLRTFDARSLKLLSVPATKTHEGVTCLKEYGHATEGGPQLLATAGRDGKVRLWDVRSGPGKSQPVVEMETGKFDCCYIERFTMTWIGLVVSLSFKGLFRISGDFHRIYADNLDQRNMFLCYHLPALLERTLSLPVQSWHPTRQQ